MIHPVLKDLLVLVSRQVPARVVPLPTEVVVDRDCGEAVLRGAHVYIPGVLGAPKCEPTSYFLFYYIFPDTKIHECG